MIYSSFVKKKCVFLVFVLSHKIVYISVNFIINPIRLKSVVFKHCTPNIWHNSIKGQIQVNPWPTYENTTGKILTSPFDLFLCYYYCISSQM